MWGNLDLLDNLRSVVLIILWAIINVLLGACITLEDQIYKHQTASERAEIDGFLRELFARKGIKMEVDRG